MTTAGRKESTPLADTVSAVTTRRKSVIGKGRARTFKLCFWYDETNMDN